MYAVILVDCLECNDGSANPEVTGYFATLEDAKVAIEQESRNWFGQIDGFIVETDVKFGPVHFRYHSEWEELE